MSRFQFHYQEIPLWPRLAWVAAVDTNTTCVHVSHGSAVETHGQWCGEVVWNGSYADGDFDHADVVMGSGVRVRADEMIFVPASDNLSQLYLHQRGTTLRVANSLAALMAVAGLDFLDGIDYTKRLNDDHTEFGNELREIPTTDGPVQFLCSDNLHVNAAEKRVIPKPARAPRFPHYACYRDYLFQTAHEVGTNLRDTSRAHRVGSLAAVSRGYDSTAVAVVAREAGVERVATIVHARREPGVLLDTDDSGHSTAAQLGLQSDLHTREHAEFPHEDAVWAVAGSVGDVNMALFDYDEPVNLVFAGFMGDRVWNPRSDLDPTTLRRWSATSGYRFSEARLELGAILCCPVYWGSSRACEIRALGDLPEMAPWALGNGYDRPVPRRLAEEAGVARETFGKHKMASTFKRKRGAPLSQSLRPDFADYLRQQGRAPVPAWKETMSLWLRAFDSLVLEKLPSTVRFSCRDWIELPTPRDFFLWANGRRRTRYREPYEAARLSSRRAS